MPSSGMLRRVDLVRTDVSEERIASIIRVTRIGGIGTTLAVTSNGSTLRRNTRHYAVSVKFSAALIVIVYFYDSCQRCRTRVSHSCYAEFYLLGHTALYYLEGQQNVYALISSMVYSWVLKIEVTCSSEMHLHF
jgi:hypothetical protein